MRNPIAKSLRDGTLTSKVVPDKREKQKRKQLAAEARDAKAATRETKPRD